MLVAVNLLFAAAVDSAAQVVAVVLFHNEALVVVGQLVLVW